MEKKKVRQYKTNTISDKLKQTLTFKEGEEFNLDEYQAETQFFILEGKKGFIVSVDFEGVHNVYEDENGLITIGLYQKPKDGYITISPKGTFQVSIKDFLSLEPEYSEYEFKDMVRTFGSRLDNNYALLLKSCKKIGLDLSDYNTERKKLLKEESI